MRDHQPLITILLPVTHFHPVFLRKAILSVMGQTSPVWELFIITNPENQVEIIEQVSSWLPDPRVQLILNQGVNLPGSLNTGMRQAQTGFVAILLGDDMWAPNAVAVLNDHIRNFPEVDFFHSARRFIDAEDNPISSVYYPEESFELLDFVHKSQAKHLLCWRVKKGLEIGGMDETINNVGPDDWDFPWCMAENGAKFMAIQEPLYLLRDHREGYRLTTHLPLSVHITETRRILRKHNVPEPFIRKKVREARRGYFKQCLYRSEFDRMIKEFMGFDARIGWREKYK